MVKCFEMTVPANTPFVEGIAAPQKDSTLARGIVKGGGHQAFFPSVPNEWMKPLVLDIKVSGKRQ